MYDETYTPVHCNWCGWSGDEADLDMNEHDEPTYCPVCVDIRTVLLTVEKMCLYYWHMHLIVSIRGVKTR